jgi:hypothetical protein
MPLVDDAARAQAPKLSVPELLLSARQARAAAMRDWLRAAWHVLTGASLPRRAPARRA